MRAQTILLMASLCLAACTATSDAAPNEGALSNADEIIGGTRDDGDPSVVLMKAEQGNTGWWCTGTVIATRLVLTAAHCVEDAGPSTKIRVMFGTDEAVAKPSDYVAVKSWHHDPLYLATNNIAAGHDAAVLILAEDAKAPPLPINRTAMTNALVGKPVHVVGFGNNNGWAGTGSGLKRHIHTIQLDTPHLFVMTLYKVVSGNLQEITSSFDLIEKQTPNGGTYFLEIWGGNGDYSPTDPYFISVDVAP